MQTATPTPLRTLQLCVTNLTEEEYRFLRGVVALLTDPMLARYRRQLRRGEASVGILEGSMEVISPLTEPAHSEN